jgi:nuclear transport factor 2 (NTF2) superfamily protein
MGSVRQEKKTVWHNPRNGEKKMKTIIKDGRSRVETIVDNYNAQSYLDRKWDEKINRRVEFCVWAVIASMIIFVLIVGYVWTI